MGYIEVIPAEKPFWAIRADYSTTKLRDVCRSTPGMTWDADTRTGLGYVDGILIVIKRLAELGIRVRPGKLPTKPTSIHNLPAATVDVRPYQKEGIDFLIANAETGALLADDMGLGKTLQALRAARALRGKVVIVTLAYGKHVWEDEIAKWWPAVRKKTQTLYGVKDPTPIDPKTQIVIINFDILYAWADEILRWKALPVVQTERPSRSLDARPLVGDGQRFGLTIDEIHLVSNPESRRGEHLHRIRAAADWCIGLSGTPLTNRPRNTYGVIELVSPGRMSRGDAKDFGGKFFMFGKRYCGGHQIDIEVKGE